LLGSGDEMRGPRPLEVRLLKRNVTAAKQDWRRKRASEPWRAPEDPALDLRPRRSQRAGRRRRS